MDSIPWGVTLAVLGVLVPVAAALYEFVVVGRKRLGYRVQMDTTATDESHSPYAGALQQIRDDDASPLVEPSFVLLRIENSGAMHIDTRDYAVLDDDQVGIRIRFPGRRVAGMVITELSDEFLRPSFTEGSGLRVRDGVIELPKVPLNRGAHYKVLAALERHPVPEPGAEPVTFAEPLVIGGIKGGVGTGEIIKTESKTGTSWGVRALVGFLVVIILAQLPVLLSRDTAPPPECAEGSLTLVGSTAFAPVLREAAAAYEEDCSGADFTVDAEGSVDGIRELDRAGREAGGDGPDMLAFSDGPKGEGHPQLLPRPLAFSLFTLVVNRETAVQDLSLEEIRRLYAGEITDWSRLGGADLPVRLVGRFSDSGTRKTFERQVLGGRREPDETSDDCERRAPGAPRGVIRCGRDSTDDVLDAVAATPGAIGYAELGVADGREDLELVRIDGQPASLEGADHGAYPFWETEYAYTFGEPGSDSLAAGFLRYLTNEVGRDIVRSHGHRPCAELQNPVRCRPR